MSNEQSRPDNNSQMSKNFLQIVYVYESREVNVWLGVAFTIKGKCLHSCALTYFISWALGHTDKTYTQQIVSYINCQLVQLRWIGRCKQHGSMDGKVGLSVGYATILVQPEIFA